MSEEPVVYLIGDAGVDEFVVDGNSKKTFEVKSGVSFMEAGLRTILGHDKIKTQLCVQKLDGAPDGTGFAALSRKEATLGQYNGTWRIKAYRNEEASPSPSLRYRLAVPPPGSLNDRRLLVAHHGGTAWTDPLDKTLPKFLADFCEPPNGKGQRDQPDLPMILVNISSAFPELREDSRASDLRSGPFKSELWNELYRHRPDVGIVMSVSTLREQGGAVTRRLSWEQSVEDLTAELHLFPRLEALSRFAHLFVRFGMVGFVHIRRQEGEPRANQLSGELHFSPYAEGGIHRDHERDGGTIGRNMVFIANLAREILKPSAGTTGERLRRTIGQSLRQMRHVDDEGYEDAVFDSDVAPCRNRTPKSKFGKGPRWRTTTMEMNPATT